LFIAGSVDILAIRVYHPPQKGKFYEFIKEIHFARFTTPRCLFVKRNRHPNDGTARSERDTHINGNLSASNGYSHVDNNPNRHTIRGNYQAGHPGGRSIRTRHVSGLS
jgi:hypothetical protein